MENVDIYQNTHRMHSVEDDKVVQILNDINDTTDGKNFIKSRRSIRKAIPSIPFIRKQPGLLIPKRYRPNTYSK